jgi:hypothetical protein
VAPSSPPSKTRQVVGIFQRRHIARLEDLIRFTGVISGWERGWFKQTPRFHRCDVRIGIFPDQVIINQTGSTIGVEQQLVPCLRALSDLLVR